MSFGMSYEQYWDGDVSAHRAFREADKIRTRRRNQEAWLQGAYFYEALCDAASLFRGMKPSRPQSYRKEPYDIDEEDRKQREEAEAREKYLRMKDKVAAFAKAFNDKRRGKTEEVSADAGCES